MRTSTITDMPLVDGPFRININVSPKYSVEDITNTIKHAVIAYHRVTDPIPSCTPQPAEHDEYGTLYRRVMFSDTWDIAQINSELTMNSNVQPMTLLAMRMGWGGYGAELSFGNPNSPPFDHISIHRNTETVFVFVVSDKKPVVIEDEASMFPSDSLVTRLRMIADKHPNAL
jgi:hypothetical protein